MANRQTGNRSGKKRNDQQLQQNFEQNQFGLKEAYTMLQQDYLGLKKAYIINEQQLLEMQEQYFILQQSYQQLQQDSQNQQAQLVEKLEKSYDAYNEKFMKVEELEEELNKSKKTQEDMNQHNENQAKVASLQDQIKQVNTKKQVFEEAVMNSLANLGLSLVTVNGHFEMKILDYKKLRQFVGYNDHSTRTVTTSKKVAELEEQNAFLQQALLSLKNYSEKQKEELARTTNMLQKKTETFLNFKQGIQKQEHQESILVEAKALQRILTGLSEVYDFVIELKKTICDQNSWIDMLVEALDEYRKSHLFKDNKNKTGATGASRVLSANHSSTQNSVGGRKKKTKKKTKNALGNKASDAASDNTGSLLGKKTKSPGEAEVVEEFEDFIIVSSEKCSTSDHGTIVNSTAHHLPLSFSSLQTETKVPMNKEPQSLHHELRQMSSLTVGDRGKSYNRYKTGSSGHSAMSDMSEQKQIGANDNNKCPICNKIFESDFDLVKRRSHINSHFED